MKKVLINESEIVRTEREQENGTHISECYFVGCKRNLRTDQYITVHLLQKMANRDKYNSAYNLMELYPSKDKAPKVVIPFMAKCEVEFLNVGEGEKPVFLRVLSYESEEVEEDEEEKI